MQVLNVVAQCTPRNLPFTETFSGTPLAACTPTVGGWTTTSVSSGAGWHIVNTNYAGGTSPEIEAYGNQACGGCNETVRLTSPPMNTNGVSSMTLSFRQRMYTTNSGASGSGIITINIESSTDGNSWTSTYSNTYIATPSLQSVLNETRTINLPSISSNTMYFRWSVSGVLFKLWGWEIDNVSITGVSAPIPPTLSGFTPSSACSGSNASVTITGTNFTGASAVTFNGVAAASFTVNSANEIVAVLPIGATTGLIAVTTPDGTANSSANFVVNTVPAQPGVISGSDTLCSGSSETYSIAQVQDATGYTWVLPNSWSGSSITESINATALQSTGSVSVTADNQCGSSLPSQLNVFVAALPVVIFDFSQNPLCTNFAPVVLTNGTPSGGVYSGVGVSSGSFDPSSLAAGGYELTYTYTNEFGCTARDTSEIAVTICTEIESNLAAPQIEVFPNPFSSKLFLKLPVFDDNAHLVITDVMGRESYHEVLYKNSITSIINSTNWPCGIYHLRIYQNTGIVYRQRIYKKN